MKILVIAHAHPDFSLGGGEIAAYTLFKEYEKSKEVSKAYYLGRIDKGQGATGKITKRRENDYLWEQSTTNLSQMTPVNQQSIANEFSEFIADIAPDAVHLHHYLNLGLEIMPIIRRLNTKTKILLTLHEFVAICENNGQMIKTNGKQLCERATHDDCARCFPGITPNDFWLRKENYLNHFKYVDYFISPSNFLLERYVEWGIPRNKIIFIENGHNHPPKIPPRQLKKNEKRNRFGFFGQINKFKGLDVVLEALNNAPQNPDLVLEINGANLEKQPDEFQKRTQTLIENLTEKGLIINNGAYSPTEIGDRMQSIDWVIVPSIWWENSPMVIQEAFSYGKPVICSNIGGMKEKVTDNFNGFHVRVNDRDNWLQAFTTASRLPTWEKCSKNVSQPPSYSSVAKEHIRLMQSIQSNH